MAAVGMAACSDAAPSQASVAGEEPTGEMTLRTTPTTGDKVSLLGFGMMRLPWVEKRGEEKSRDEIDQEMVNQLVDYAIAHGVNYFDTSPAYCRGLSERATGIALARYPRKEHYIATKLSNFDPSTWSHDASVEMYHNSFKELQTDYIDYMLLHSIGSGKDGMGEFEERYIKNGILDFLLEERKAGRIRNLGFSYHGDVAVFDRMLAENDKYKWDFVQIQLNYLDWNHAKKQNSRNTDAEYLYGELAKRGIPAVIMEPMLGGRLAKVPDRILARFKQRDMNSTPASWAFRFAGTHPGVLTVLSGMNRMEHLEENVRTYSPLRLLNEEELAFLQEVATNMVEFDTVPCTACQYCMPCPYGIDIPTIFDHYNKCVNEGNVSGSVQDANYREARRAYLVGYDRSVPKLRQASHCVGCGQCTGHCPQSIDIPAKMRHIDRYAEWLRRTDINASVSMNEFVREQQSEE